MRDDQLTVLSVETILIFLYVDTTVIMALSKGCSSLPEMGDLGFFREKCLSFRQ